jgi:hypothetical protein
VITKVKFDNESLLSIFTALGRGSNSRQVTECEN